jgi:PspAA-like protein
VIVRISNEAQYRLDDDLHARLNGLDDDVVTAVEAGDEARFHATYEELLRFVREQGTELPDDDLHPSQFILPPADLSFEEAREAGHFDGEGLIPDSDPAPDAA